LAYKAGVAKWLGTKHCKDGVINPAEAAAAGGTFNNASVANAVAAVGSDKKGGATELLLYQKVSVGVTGATNPWLQEMPDRLQGQHGITYLVVSPAKAKSLLNIDLANGGQLMHMKCILKNKS
jgi:molybdopterin-containing oxidoreductase family iron-sulfur binding subunit